MAAEERDHSEARQLHVPMGEDEGKTGVGGAGFVGGGWCFCVVVVLVLVGWVLGVCVGCSEARLLVDSCGLCLCSRHPESIFCKDNDIYIKEKKGIGTSSPDGKHIDKSPSLLIPLLINNKLCLT